MAYEKYVKQEFVDYPDANATVLKAEHLEHIEAGLVAMEECVEQAQADIENIQNENQYSISAERFEEASSAIGGSPVTGVRVYISKRIVDSEGNISFEDYYTDVYDGNDGATVHGLSIYPFDPGNADLSGNVDVADVTITIPDDGRWLQTGDFLVTASGKIYRVTQVGAAGDYFTVEQFTSLGGSSGGGGTLCVTVTDTYGDTMTADKTVDELLEAYNNGMTLVCRADVGNGNYLTYQLYGVNTADKEVVFAFEFVFGGESITQSTLNFTEDGVEIKTSSVSQVRAIPYGGTPGQVLTIADDSSLVWADPPSGGTSTIPSAEEVGF